MLQVVNSLLDRYFVGHLPQDALTGYGSAASLMFLLFSLGVALGTAPTAIVARAFGAGNMDEARLANRKAFGVAIALGFLVAALAIPLLRPAAMALTPRGADEAQRQFLAFMQVYCVMLPATFIIQSLAGTLRALGDTKSPMVISGVQILLHIGLNFVLINDRHVLFGVEIPGLGWGLVGSAAALAISGWLAAIAYVLWVARTPLGPCWIGAMPDLGWVKRLLRIAAPAAVNALVRVSSFAALTVVLAMTPAGKEALAALPVGIAVEAIAFMPAFGLAVSAQALVGQSLGMGKPERAMRLGWLAAHHSAVVSLVFSALLVAFARPIAESMLSEQSRQVVDIAVQYIIWISLTEVMFSYAVVLFGAMQGAGDTVAPLWLTVIFQWLLRIPLAAFLALTLGGAGLALGALGVWLAMSISQTVQGLASMWVWQRGAWALREV